MKRLTIMRHGAATEPRGGASDVARELTGEGLEQARRQGRVLTAAGIAHDRVIASSAVRARQTAEALAEAGKMPCAVEAADELYNVSGDALLEFLRELPDDVASVLLVAHLPGVAQLLSLLATEHVDLDHVFSPGTLATVHLEGDTWRNLDYGTTALVLFLPPVVPAG